MAVDVLLGLQWGDEGKGKVADLIAPQYDIVARFQGGPNAGHTLVVQEQQYILHTIPSGIIHKETLNVIGNGVVVDPQTLKQEIEELEDAGINVRERLYISDKAHLILPGHRALDAAYEEYKGSNKIGSTLKGIGPTYQDKASREGLRVGDIFEGHFQEKLKKLNDKHRRLLDSLGYEEEVGFQEWFEALEFLKTLKVEQTEYLINKKLKEGHSVLAEGAQGALLDIDYGTYPFVTSSNTIASQACTGLGVPPSSIGRVYGIMKAYTTRVGSGPFPTELNDEVGDELKKAGNEFGATTGRPRRCGWLDLAALRYAIMLNGVTELILTKADVLSQMQEIKVANSYQLNGKVMRYANFIGDEQKHESSPELLYESFKPWNGITKDVTCWEEFPLELKNYLKYLEKELDVPFMIVSVGPARSETVFKRELI